MILHIKHSQLVGKLVEMLRPLSNVLDDAINRLLAHLEEHLDLYFFFYLVLPFDASLDELVQRNHLLDKLIKLSGQLVTQQVLD